MTKQRTTADEPVPNNGKPILGVLRQCPSCGAQNIDPRPHRDISCQLCGNTIEAPK